MKIAIIAQEEPVFIGPMIKRLIQAKNKDVVILVLVGLRGAAGKPASLIEALRRLYTYWLIFEPAGFFKCTYKRAVWLLSRTPFFKGHDFFCLERSTARIGIPVKKARKMTEAMEMLKHAEPDLIINQSDILLGKGLLDIPKAGVIGRHGSLLPEFRGRTASFWCHFNQKGYGVTIYFLDKGIDTGPIIFQKKLNINPSASYFEVLETIFAESDSAIISAISLIESGAAPKKQGRKGELCKFPTVAEAKVYRKILAMRR